MHTEDDDIGEDTVADRLENIKTDEEKKPFLTFIKGSRLGELIEIVEPVVVAGRGSDVGLRIEDSAISRKHFQLSLASNKVWIEDLNSKNGTYVNGQLIKSKTQLEDGDKIQISRATILEFTYLDETRSLSEKQRYEMGVMDALTGIHNKRYFMDRIVEEFSFAQRQKGKLSIIIFDVDYFKKVNDTYGHLAGDLVLQKIAQAVANSLRSGDLFARYGGEEFVVAIRDGDIKQAFETGERIRKLVASLEINFEGQKIATTISCGATSIDEKFRDYVGMIAEADKFLYRAKKEGRNRTCSPTF